MKTTLEVLQKVNEYFIDLQNKCKLTTKEEGIWKLVSEKIDDENYTQLVVWESTLVGKEKIEKFETWMKKEFNARVKYLEEVKTLPGNGGEGGRNDLFFYIHSDDIGGFAVKRLKYGMRWWEDVLGNGNSHLYPKQILDKYKPTWSYAG